MNNIVDYSVVYTEEYKKSVYIPSEDTFFFVDTLHKDFHNISTLNPVLILELGCGSGYISTYILNLFLTDVNKPGHIIPMCISTDINPLACLSTSQMIMSNKVNNYSECICMDLFNNLTNFKFDIILFNPPYVVGDLEGSIDMIDRAWNGGINGSETIVKFINSVSGYISAGGYVYLVRKKVNYLISCWKREIK
eukprot:XP_764201.1 DNA-methyltransferase [Theileria parva strain Muguga]